LTQSFIPCSHVTNNAEIDWDTSEKYSPHCSSYYVISMKLCFRRDRITYITGFRFCSLALSRKFREKVLLLYCATNSTPDASEFNLLALSIKFDSLHKVDRWRMCGAAWKTPLSRHIVACALPEVASTISILLATFPVFKTRIRIQWSKFKTHFLAMCIRSDIMSKHNL
jgi:hypothetical protein